jgi:hypothetical protein
VRAIAFATPAEGKTILAVRAKLATIARLVFSPPEEQFSRNYLA